jgi:hypothetical protein
MRLALLAESGISAPQGVMPWLTRKQAAGNQNVTVIMIGQINSSGRPYLDFQC